MAHIVGQLIGAQLENIASDPTPATGQVWFNTNTGLAKWYDGSATRVIIGRDTTDTLTNKTIDSAATGNAITLAASTLTSGAVLATRGGTGVQNNILATLTRVGNHDLQFTTIGTTTITLPLTGTMATLAGSETLTNKTISGSSNTLTNLSADNISSGVLPANRGGTGTANNVLATLARSGNHNLEFTTTATTNLTLPTSGTVAINPTTTRGDIIYASATASPGTLARLAIGASGTVLHGGTDPSWSAVVNADVDAAAAIAFSKLATLASGNILVGSAGAVATSVVMSGDATIIASGALTIANLAITNAKVSASAAIDFSKLATLTSGNILVGSAGNVATSVAMSGDATIIASGALTIANLAITNAKVATAAAIAYTKIDFTGAFATTTITKTSVTDITSMTKSTWVEVASAFRLSIAAAGTYLIQAQICGYFKATVSAGNEAITLMGALSTSSTPGTGFSNQSGPILDTGTSTIPQGYSFTFNEYLTVGAAATVYYHVNPQALSSGTATNIEVATGPPGGVGIGMFIRAIKLPL